MFLDCSFEMLLNGAVSLFLSEWTAGWPRLWLSFKRYVTNTNIWIHVFNLSNDFKWWLLSSSLNRIEPNSKPCGYSAMSENIICHKKKFSKVLVHLTHLFNRFFSGHWLALDRNDRLGYGCLHRTDTMVNTPQLFEQTIYFVSFHFFRDENFSQTCS